MPSNTVILNHFIIMNKKSIIILAIIFLSFNLISCDSEKSRQKKAENLISQKLNEELPDIESYQNISFELDTIDNPLLADSLSYELADQWYNIKMDEFLVKSNIEDIERKKKNLKTNASNHFWFGNLDGYDMIKYGQQFKNLDSELESYQYELEDIELIKQSIEEGFGSLLTKYQDVVMPGWKVSHKYRAKDNMGNMQIYNYTYFLSPELDRILYFYDNESEEIDIRLGIINEIANRVAEFRSGSRDSTDSSEESSE